MTGIKRTRIIFGKLIYKWAGNRPAGAFGPLNMAFSAVAMKSRYFPDKKLMPSRQYIAARVTMEAIVRPVVKASDAALVNIFLPCEPLHAMGLRAILPEAISNYLASAAAERYFVEKAEQNGVPETFCSYHKVMIGLSESGVLPKPRFVINTSLACDANQLSFRRIAEFYGVPQYYIDVPMSQGPEALNYVTQQLRGMTGFISRHTGRAIEEEKLKQAVRLSRLTIENYRQYLRLRATRSLSDEMTSELYSVVSNHVLLGTPEAFEYSRRLVADTARVPEGLCRKRILWIHTLPNWQDALKEVLDFSDRCEIVASDMAFDGLSDMDEDRPYESMARRLLENSFNGGAERRLEKAAEMARLLNADGVIYFCHWGCKQTLGAAALAKDYFESRGWPTLLLDGDGCDSANVSDGQMRTRVEAFLEQLETVK